MSEITLCKCKKCGIMYPADEKHRCNVLIQKAYQQGRADAIDEFDSICEEARNHKFGVCDADFVVDVIKAKVKEQLKEQKK